MRFHHALLVLTASSSVATASDLAAAASVTDDRLSSSVGTNADSSLPNGSHPIGEFTCFLHVNIVLPSLLLWDTCCACLLCKLPLLRMHLRPGKFASETRFLGLCYERLNAHLHIYRQRRGLVSHTMPCPPLPLFTLSNIRHTHTCGHAEPCAALCTVGDDAVSSLRRHLAAKLFLRHQQKKEEVRRANNQDVVLAHRGDDVGDDSDDDEQQQLRRAAAEQASAIVDKALAAGEMDGDAILGMINLVHAPDGDDDGQDVSGGMVLPSAANADADESRSVSFISTDVCVYAQDKMPDRTLQGGSTYMR